MKNTALRDMCNVVLTGVERWFSGIFISGKMRSFSAKCQPRNYTLASVKFDWSARTGISILVLISTSGFGLAVDAAEPEASFKDCALCPEMVWLPAGAFTMGRDGGKSAEAPAHRAEISKPFAIARTEITFDQYKACHDDGACAEMPWDRDWGRDDRPVIYVTFEMASHYAAWLSLKTGRAYRLPTEREWEYAAWGGEQDWRNGDGIANCHGCFADWNHQTTPVAQFPANGFGLFDMRGNVMEWTADCWTETHSPSAPDCDKRTRKGGSWYFDAFVSTPTYRFGGRLAHTGYDIGFRVVAD